MQGSVVVPHTGNALGVCGAVFHNRTLAGNAEAILDAAGGVSDAVGAANGSIAEGAAGISGVV